MTSPGVSASVSTDRRGQRDSSLTAVSTTAPAQSRGLVSGAPQSGHLLSPKHTPHPPPHRGPAGSAQKERLQAATRGVPGPLLDARGRACSAWRPRPKGASPPCASPRLPCQPGSLAATSNRSPAFQSALRTAARAQRTAGHVTSLPCSRPHPPAAPPAALARSGSSKQTGPSDPRAFAEALPRMHLLARVSLHSSDLNSQVGSSRQEYVRQSV